MSRRFVLKIKVCIIKSIPYIMPPERVINIDTFEDLYVAELRINEK